MIIFGLGSETRRLENSHMIIAYLNDSFVSFVRLHIHCILNIPQIFDISMHEILTSLFIVYAMFRKTKKHIKDKKDLKLDYKSNPTLQRKILLSPTKSLINYYDLIGENQNSLPCWTLTPRRGEL